MNPLLFNDYYIIEGNAIDNLRGLFFVSINPRSKIFKGHFPGNPICPGVCHIEMIRECASLIMNDNMRFAEICKSRFTAVAKPDESCKITLFINLTSAEKYRYNLVANISDGDKTYLTMSAVMYRSKV